MFQQPQTLDCMGPPKSVNPSKESERRFLDALDQLDMVTSFPSQCFICVTQINRCILLTIINSKVCHDHKILSLNPTFGILLCRLALHFFLHSLGGSALLRVIWRWEMAVSTIFTVLVFQCSEIILRTF